MHSRTRSHASIFGISWNPADPALAIALTLLFFVFLFLFLIVTAQPAEGQNSVPPTAVQAAKMPQFASRLAPPSKRLPSAGSARGHLRPGPRDSNDIYDNGPINGNTDAWTINFGFVVSDTFYVVNDGTPVTGMTFAAWLAPGDTLQSAELSITSGANSGTSYFDQTVSFTQSNCVTNSYGYNVCTATTSFTGPTLNSGTLWVNLQNASLPNGDPVYWDENSGIGCTSQGCPSQADENSVGSIPSESFTVLGNATTTTTSSTTTYSDFACPSPQRGFHDLHDFSSSAGPSGLAIDTAGKLYGAFANGGSYGAGLLYDFTQRAGHWFVSLLYSFLGGSHGSSPNGAMVGPSGALYGAAQGGIQTCGYNGSSYCGLIYEAEPSANVCSTALCSWNETTIYQFTGNSDAWGGIVTAFDSAGNLYGIGGGGAYGAGAVFELSPSGGGWTEKILYSFAGGNDGWGPNSLLLGHDGNLYGTAEGGNDDCGYGYTSCGVVFQLVPLGSGWTENVIYSFTGTTDGFGPGGLIQDSQGNLYGFSVCYGPLAWGYCELSTGGGIEGGLIFKMSPSAGGWSFNVIYNAGLNQRACSDNGWGISSNIVNGLTLDAAGNLYDAEGGVLGFCNAGNCNDWVELSCGQITNVGSGEVLFTGDSDIFWNITSDANGNLYGTTSTCGFGTLQRTDGMIWQYSP
jgi:hypothetical protein